MITLAATLLLATVPRPVLEDVSLRNAIMHLLHHVDALAADREPAVQAA